MKRLLRFLLNGYLSPASYAAEFDIEGQNVFSVERDEKGNTVFGYYRMGPKMVADGSGSYKVLLVEETHEWMVASTDEQHRAFVARLTAKLAKRDGAK